MTYAVDVPSRVTREEVKFLRRLASETDGPILELGSHFGRSTIALASSGKLVHSVDWHRGDPEVGFAGANDSLGNIRRNLKNYNLDGSVVHHIGSFDDVLPMFADGSFGGIFVDWYHDDVRTPLRATGLKRLVKPGGWVVWHDYGRFNVAEVVHDCEHEWGAHFEVSGFMGVLRV